MGLQKESTVEYLPLEGSAELCDCTEIPAHFVFWIICFDLEWTPNRLSFRDALDVVCVNMQGLLKIILREIELYVASSHLGISGSEF